MCECLPTGTDVHKVHTCCSQKAEEKVRFFRAGVTDNCGLPYAFREPNSDPVKAAGALNL